MVYLGNKHNISIAVFTLLVGWQTDMDTWTSGSQTSLQKV